MTAILLAIASSLAYGAADFLGGFAARGARVVSVVAIASPASLLVEFLLWPVFGARFSSGAVSWGATSGVASAASFVLLYRTLAIGPMSVLSPVTAVISAVLPVAVGLLTGERVGALAIFGIVIALIAVTVVSGSSDGHGARPSPAALSLAGGAGVAIAVQLICLDQAPKDSGVAPLLMGRSVSSAIVLGAAMLLGGCSRPSRPTTLIPAYAGALDSLANFAFLLAVRAGELAVVAVITALYPASTLVLARAVIRERIGPAQMAGLGLAAVAVSLLAVA